MPKTHQEILEVVTACGIGMDGWRFRLEGVGPAIEIHGDDYQYEHYFLQACFIRTNTWNGETAEEGRGRKWLISPHMTESELVLTCLKAVITNQEHEAREAFTYKGVHIFQPHPDITTLLAVAEDFEVRSADDFR